MDDDELVPQDALAQLEAAALRSGQQVGLQMGEPPPPRYLTAFLDGFSLHAATKVHENDHQGREALCAYGARGPIASSRLSQLPDARFRYRMKRAKPDGATELVLTGVELLRKLAPLIPPPRQNLTRYHGVFAPNAKLRGRVVALARGTTAVVDATRRSALAAEPAPSSASPAARSTYRLDWAALLKRVFRVDVLQCASCGGRMRMIAFVTKPDAVRRILRHLGLPDEPLPVERARGPPQPAFRLVTPRRSAHGARGRSARVVRTRERSEARRDPKARAVIALRLAGAGGWTRRERVRAVVLPMRWHSLPLRKDVAAHHRPGRYHDAVVTIEFTAEDADTEGLASASLVELSTTCLVVGFNIFVDGDPLMPEPLAAPGTKWHVRDGVVLETGARIQEPLLRVLLELRGAVVDLTSGARVATVFLMYHRSIELQRDGEDVTIEPTPGRQLTVKLGEFVEAVEEFRARVDRFLLAACPEVAHRAREAGWLDPVPDRSQRE